MSFRSRGTRSDERPAARHIGYGASRSRQSEAPSLLCPFIAGITFAAAILYVSGWDLTGRAGKPPSVIPKGRLDPWVPLPEGPRATRSSDVPTGHGDVGGYTPIDSRNTGEGSNSVFSLGNERHLFDAADVAVIDEALKRYRAFASSTLEADEKAVRDGQPLQGKYIVLDSGNELVNRLRGVLSGIFLGILTDRVFVADITYQKDTKGGLLSELFEGPGYQWDLSKLSLTLRRALAADKPHFRGAGGGLTFDMSEDNFRRWVCEDVVGGRLSSTSVVTLSTVVYPFPLLARNPSYAAHPILSSGSAAAGFVGGGQGRVEALETLVTRAVLRPTLELRERARGVVEEVRRAAKAWGVERGVEGPVKVVGLHIRTYFVKAIAEGSLESNLKQFADCAVVGDDRDNTFYFVATDEAATQALASKVWGKGCYFVPFTLPGRKLDGIKAAFVDLLVMGSLDDYVMTPHSSFSELGSTLSFTWLPDDELSLRTRPNRPIVPLFPQMNDFERRKVMSLMDRRGGPLFHPGEGLVEGGRGSCMRAYAAGMSLAIAVGKRLTSMFEVIEHASCLEGRAGIIDPKQTSMM